MFRVSCVSFFTGPIRGSDWRCSGFRFRVREREEDTSVEEEEIEEEVEAVDPKPEVEDSCKPRCVKQLISYELNIGTFFLGWMSRTWFLRC